MKLREYESKQLLDGLKCSEPTVVRSVEELSTLTSFPLIVKVQVVANGRGKAGGVREVTHASEARAFFDQFIGKPFLGEPVEAISFEPKISFDHEYYVAIMIDTSLRTPVLVFSSSGGVDVEDSKHTIIPIDYLRGIDADVLLGNVSGMPDPEAFVALCLKLYAIFVSADCRMIELNPLVYVDGYMALDCVAVLDDDARYRAKHSFEERTGGRAKTTREALAHAIDREDHRGIAGKTFLDLDGDIAVLASGGGASLTLMDALLSYGGKPANYTEYSGNPPREKVEKLTRIVLDRANLSGLLVAGVIANFTDIYETLRGVVSVLIELKPSFPIVIRRAGPNDDQAKAMVLAAKEEHGLDIHFFDEHTPLTEAAKIIVDLSTTYKVRT